MHCLGKVYLCSCIAITVDPMEDLIIMYKVVMDLCELGILSSLEAVGR